MLLEAVRAQVVALTDVETWDKITYNLGPEILHTLLTDDSKDFINYLETNKDKYGLTTAEVVVISNVDSHTIIGAAYQPNPEITAIDKDLIPTSDTETITISGTFCDYITSQSFVGMSDGGGSINFVSKSFSTYVVSVTTTGVVQDYDLILTDASGTTFSFVVSAQNINVYTPNTAANGATGLELWNQIESGMTVSNGGFAAENSGGNGWNEACHFGGAFNATSILIVEFAVSRLDAASNAYGHIRMNNTTNTSTTGNPRMYISVGSTTRIFNSAGGVTSTTTAVGDNYKIVYTPTSMETFKNGNSIQTHIGTYNINTMFFKVTAYRVLACSDIKIITD